MGTIGARKAAEILKNVQAVLGIEWLAAAQAVDLRGVFDGSRTADETAGKPHPLMLQELMAEFGVPAERVLMVGDTTHDLEMAQRAGCASVGVAYGAHATEGFAAFAPLTVAASVAELDAWLRREA